MIELPEILNIPDKLIPVITNINNYNYFLIEGGRGGGKSQSIARIILWLAEQKNVRSVNKQLAKNRKIKDSTPLLAVRNFSSGMMSGATSPATNWFKIKIRDYKLE